MVVRYKTLAALQRHPEMPRIGPASRWWALMVLREWTRYIDLGPGR